MEGKIGKRRREREREDGSELAERNAMGLLSRHCLVYNLVLGGQPL